MPGLGAKLQAMPKQVIYLVLILVTTVPLFFDVAVPNEPLEATQDYYATLEQLPEGSRVLLASDWTGSTRGESKGAFRSTLNILIRRKAKVAFYTTADPQAPRVAQDAINELNAERRRANLPEFKRWEDWISLGYFPDSEAANNGIANDLLGAFSGRKDFPPGAPPRDVFASPVLQGITKVGQIPLLLIVTASKTSNFTVERIKPDRKTGYPKLLFAVTGVMVPETQVFYQSKQIAGYCGGLKGVYDLEQLMENGINFPSKDKAVVKSDKYDVVPGYPSPSNKGQGTRYYPTLHFALALMILLVIVGNVGMALSKREAKS
jgi:hypothetical protein